MGRDNNEQMDIFSYMQRLVSEKNEGVKPTSTDLGTLISELDALMRNMKKEEDLEQKRKEEAKRQVEEAPKQEVTSLELSMDWENPYETGEADIQDHAESIPDGFMKCLNRKGRVDIDYIAAICGVDRKSVIDRLKGSIYQNPLTWEQQYYKGWETAEEYLSGNIRQKLAAASKANKEFNGYFNANVAALKAVLPPTVCAEEIYATLGSPWIPANVIEDFVGHLRDRIQHKKHYGYNYYTGTKSTCPVSFHYDKETGSWECSSPRCKSWMLDEAYGTSDYSAIEIIYKTLNMQSLVVTKAKRVTGARRADVKKDYEKVLDKNATLEAMEKQRALIHEFQEWVWADNSRKELLENIYNKKFGGIRQRHFDGSFLELPGMNPAIELFPYQKNAVARIIFSPNTLLSHDVGSGKTYIMIAAGMELHRLGLSKKNMYVVPNNIIGQWRKLFYELYPEADLLCIEPKDFTPARRDRALREIRFGNYDAVIMAYSSFNAIKVSLNYRLDQLEEEYARLKAIPFYLMGTRLKRKQKKIADRIEKLRESRDETDLDICFEELGITRLFVDEAHNFKNVPIETKLDNVMGISSTGSEKCSDMLEKVRIVQHNNDGGGVVFATGTPITNSITDAYIMQSYLQSGALSVMDLQSFDSWVGMFAEKSQDFEVDVDTTKYRMATRFSKFHNIPELTNLLASVADFHQMDASADIPDHDGYEDVVVHKTAEFKAYLEEISQRADKVRAHAVSRKDDNMLLVTTDGRKAALDMRLVKPDSRFTVASKVFKCAEQVAKIYKDTEAERLTQLVFCDTSTPKTGFNIYDELKSLLVRMGVDEAEIAYVHDATTEKKREKLFENMRKGVIRVLIGSTFKLGLGVNVQNKLIALHHLDVPWRPADMVQREGRILRQGNENKKVRLLRYITEGSFDAYSWQLLETKQRFITDLLSGCTAERSGADVDDTVLNYAEVKALAVGNPLIKERVETANELMKYTILQKKLTDKRKMQEASLPGMKERAKQMSNRLPGMREDAAFFAAARKEYTPEERKALRETIYKASHTLEPAPGDTLAATYQGFEVIAPKNSSIVHPVVFLKHKCRYMVELGGSDAGNLVRIDNTLENLSSEADKLESKLEELKRRITYLEEELKKTEDYSETIAEIKAKLEKMDKKLGVENQ